MRVIWRPWRWREDRLFTKTFAAHKRYFCIWTCSYLTRILPGRNMYGLNSRPGHFPSANVFGRAQPTRDQDGEGGQVFWSETSSKNQVSQLSSWCFANNALPRKDKDDASVVLAVIKVQVILKFWILLECRNVVILTCALQLYSAWLTLKGERLKRAAVSLLESLASLALEVKPGKEEGMWWTEGDGGISRITNWWVTGGIALPTWTLALLPSR